MWQQAAPRDDVCHICYGYGLFTGGAGLDGGSHKVGCLTLPMSSGNTDRQIQFMNDMQSTILCCTPSYAAYIAESMEEKGIKNNTLKAGIFGAEPWTEEMRHSIEKSLGIKAYDIYGLTETSGPGVAFECCEQNGMHINEDHFLAEIIDPDTGEVLPEGSVGELVFTSLDKEAFPLLRYRTRDLCVLSRKKCSCGRTFIKMSKPLGRSDDMMIIRGVNVFPSQIETVLLNEGYTPNYQIVLDRVKNTDTFDINVELSAGQFSDTVREITAREKKLASAIKGILGISPDVHLVTPKTIARSEGKAVRVIDKKKTSRLGGKTMAIKQLSVFVENKEGKLREITDILAKAGIDIRALSIADTSEFGILRLIVRDPQKAKALLEKNGFVATINDVVGVEINDRPGGLAEIVKLFAERDINMEYMYAFLTRTENKAYLVVRVDDASEVENLLESEKIRILTPADIDNM